MGGRTDRLAPLLQGTVLTLTALLALWLLSQAPPPPLFAVRTAPPNSHVLVRMRIGGRGCRHGRVVQVPWLYPLKETRMRCATRS